MPQVVSITPELSSIYRDVRLRALQTDPFAFGSTYAREAQFDDAEWQRRAASLDREMRVGFLAMDADVPCGLVACFRDEQDAKLAEVISMWVAPSYRGTGLSARLLDAIREWARLAGCSALQLMVTSSNGAAIKFYERYGFVKTGRTEMYPNDTSLYVIELFLPIARD